MPYSIAHKKVNYTIKQTISEGWLQCTGGGEAPQPPRDNTSSLLLLLHSNISRPSPNYQERAKKKKNLPVLVECTISRLNTIKLLKCQNFLRNWFKLKTTRQPLRLFFASCVSQDWSWCNSHPQIAEEIYSEFFELITKKLIYSYSQLVGGVNPATRVSNGYAEV